MDKKIFKTDYSGINEFDRAGYHYSKIFENDEYIVWKMGMDNARYFRAEVWKKRFSTNPDGRVVTRAISDEEFGRYGWYFVGNEDKVKSDISKRFGISCF